MPLANVIISGAIAAAASGVVLPPPVSADVPLNEAQAPVFSVGEEWEFAYSNVLDPRQNHNYTQRVESLDSGGAHLSVASVGGAPSQLTLDADGNAVEGSNGRFTPSTGQLHFPMRVGSEWSASYVFSNGGWSANDERHAEVVGKERVETPAGSFETFRIESVIVWTGGGANHGVGRATEKDWYAPSVGRIIKQEFQDIPNSKANAPTTTRFILIRHTAG